MVKLSLQVKLKRSRQGKWERHFEQENAKTKYRGRNLHWMFTKSIQNKRGKINQFSLCKA